MALGFLAPLTGLAAPQIGFNPRDGSVSLPPSAFVMATDPKGRPQCVGLERGTADIVYDAQGRATLIRESDGLTRLIEYAARGPTNGVFVWTTEGRRTAYRLLPGREEMEDSDPDGRIEVRVSADLRSGLQHVWTRGGGETLSFAPEGRGGGFEVVNLAPGRMPFRRRLDAAGHPVEWQSGPAAFRCVVGDPQSPDTLRQVGAGGVVRSPDGRTEVFVQGGKLVLTRLFDAAGRLVEMRRPDGAAATFDYDASGRVARAVGYDGAETACSYDGGATRIALPDGSERVIRESAGGALREEGRGETRRSIRLVTDRLNETTTCTLDGFETQRWYAPRRERVALYQSDVFGSWFFLKDEFNGTITRSDPFGGLVTYRFDGEGRIVSKTDVAGAVLAAFRYDDDGRWAEARSRDSRLTCEYDDFNRPVRLQDWPAGLALTLAYDAIGGLASIGDSDGEQTTYARDASGRLAEARSKGAGVFRLRYGAGALPEALERPNGVTTRWRYDADGRICEVAHAGPGGVLAGFACAYDAAGRVTEIRDAGGGRFAHAYDAFGHMHVASTNASEAAVLAFDAWGNSAAMYGDAVIYGRPGCPSAVGSARIRCDAAGRLVETVDGTNRNAFAYDADHRLSGATGRDGTLMNWSYDAFGRVAKYAEGTEARRFTHLGDRIYATTDAAGKRLRTYVRLPDLGLCVAVIRGDGTVAYPLADVAGTITHLTDRDGRVTGAREFSPLGTRYSSADPLQIDLGFRSAPSFRDHIFLYWDGRLVHAGFQRALAMPAVEPSAIGLHAGNPVSFMDGNPLRGAGMFVPDEVRL